MMHWWRLEDYRVYNIANKNSEVKMYSVSRFVIITYHSSLMIFFNRQLSRHLVTLWVTGHPTAMGLLKRIMVRNLHSILPPQPAGLFLFSGNQTLDVLHEFQNQNHKIDLVDCTPALNFSCSFWTCVERVTAVSSTGSPPVFSQRVWFLGTHQKNYSLWERDQSFQGIHLVHSLAHVQAIAWAAWSTFSPYCRPSPVTTHCASRLTLKNSMHWFTLMLNYWYINVTLSCL